MERYQITDLERLTGIKAHTIRIWEKRYELIKPHRTATNIRYYDDSQVRKLINVASLIEHGSKISEIAKLSADEMAGELDKIQNADHTQTDAICTGLINQLINATIAYSEADFEKTFSSAVTRLGMEKAILDVVYPFLKRVGILWGNDKVTSLQEHFASHIVRRKLLAAIDGLPGPVRNDKKVLLFLPPDEWHELGLLFADFLLKSAGYPTVYLGQNVPLANLHAVIKDTGSTHLLTFFVSRRQCEETISILHQLRKKIKNLEIIVCGNADLLANIKYPAGVHYYRDPAALLANL